MPLPRRIRRALITGIAGSGGSYMAEHIARAHPEVEIHGIARWHSTTTPGNLSAIADRVVLHECDLTDLGSVITALRDAKPDGIFHLASYANVRASFITPLAVLQNNVMGTANLFEAVRLSGTGCAILHCSTSEVYGRVEPGDVPIREECPIRAANPYAVSKVTQDMLAQSYYLNYGLDIVRTRMFAYINPRRADLFATAFAMQVARIEAGLQSELLHGNLDSTRTLIDVRDAMDAYWVALEQCRGGEAYNIGGRSVVTVGEFLELLKQKAACAIPSRVDPALLRPTDVTLQIPDTRKFEQETGWQPKRTLDESVSYLLECCRAEALRERARRL